MTNDDIKLNRLESAFEQELEYPVARAEIVKTFSGTTVLLADGEADLASLVGDIEQDAFDSASDLYTALQNVLPIEAVGEPGQSDGDS